MTTKNKKVIGSWPIFILVTSFYTLIQGHVEGSQTLEINKFGPKPKGTITTIKVPEDGDIIDCVDIYKQPAFDNPLIKDTKMVPSMSYLSLFNKTTPPQHHLIQNWHKYGECPEGTIPIRRTWKNESVHGKSLNYNHLNTREYATAFQTGSIYHGGGAIFNLWNPQVKIGPEEFSLSQLWMVSGRHPPLNTIEAGWIVYPKKFHDSRTRFFIYWTGDGYNETGCYNLDCEYFVQTDRNLTLGGAIGPISIYGGDQYEMTINIVRDWETNRWWLQVNGNEIGYFPPTNFTSLDIGADIQADFGGEIVNQEEGNRHTTTQMGSGHHPTEGLRKASYLRNIMVVNKEYKIVDASLNFHVSRPACYSLNFGPPETSWKSHFYYGGPGYSHDCP